MEIAFLSPNSIRIKGKQGVLMVDPGVNGAKQTADVVVVLQASDAHKNFAVEGARLMIYGVGDYEVANIKITSNSFAGELVHAIRIDGASVTIGSAKALSGLAEQLNETQILVVRAGDSLGQAVTALGPRVLVLYGEGATEDAKNFGKEGLTPVGKYVISAEKLPQDMEVVLLG
ncbi:MAG: hypothetical protein AAB907_03765 [Patescibacteria group bacterium]